MAEIKPLGSEKLNGDEKLKRILELTYYNEKNKKSTSNKPELVKESKNGCVYGIVKEKDGYYVKSGLNESSLDYIGGMFMKNKNKFSSYADAFKRLEFIKGQEELNEATKYVLKSNSPKTESPLSDPTADAPIAPPVETPEPAPAPAEEPSDVPMEPEVGSEEPSAETEPEVPGESKRSDYMAEVQKYAGKLGQELRDLHDKMESDDIKYVLNMIISAVDLDKLEDDDIEEIGKKFERDEEEGMDSEEPAMEPEVPEEEPTGDEELGEEDITMDALERFINTPMDTDEIDLSKYADLEEEDLDEIMVHPDSSSSFKKRLSDIKRKSKEDEESRRLDIADKHTDIEGLEKNIFDRYHKLLDMGHDRDEARRRVWGGIGSEKYGWERLNNIDMTPPSTENEDLEEENWNLDESGNYDANSRSYTFNPEGDMNEEKPKQPKPRPEIGAHGEEHMDEEVELDLEEIKKEINNSINTTLGKYFK